MQNVKHHHIPVCYQKNFSDISGKVWVLNEEGKVFSAKPTNVFKDAHLYTTKGSLEPEKLLSEMEGQFARIFREKISKNLPITEEEKLLLAMFSGAMLARTLGFRFTFDDFLGRALEMGERMKEVVRRNPEAKKIFSGIAPSGSSMTMDEVREIKEDMSSFQGSSIITTVVDTAPILMEMKWTFLVAQGPFFFVSSDNPLHMCRPEAEKKYGIGAFGSSAGLGCKDVEITFPLSSDIALFAGWENPMPAGYLPVPEEFVRTVNYRTIRSAYSIFAKERKILESFSKRSPK